jgi:hypothetical protein
LPESIAILAYTRERNITFSSALFPVVADSKAEKAVKDFRGTVFPEDAISDAIYTEKARNIMKKMMGVSITIKPESTKGTIDYRRIK